MTSIQNALTAIAFLALGSCGPDEPTPEVFTWGENTAEVSPPELFTWTDCGIEFSPPPAEWRRQRSQESVEGVRSHVARVPPGTMHVGYYRLLHRGHTVRSVASGSERRFEVPGPDFTLDDVVDRVFFDPESLPDPEHVVVQREEARSVDGRAALSVDYTWEDVQHTFHGRELYVVAGDQLFVAKVRGTEADLELFERLVASIRFHPDPALSE